MVERRSEPRLMCADMVEVRWRDGSGHKHSSTALLEDISCSGACLQLDAPVPLDTRIEVSYRKGRLEGVVCYCFFREIGYWVGVQFTTNNKWSKREFRPRHLLDLKKILTKARPAPHGPPVH